MGGKDKPSSASGSPPVKTFYLIDGHAQIFRAYYAPFGQLTSPTGESTKAVFIFTQMILSMLNGEKPEYLAVALDVSDETTERKKLYPEYKANRDETPEDFSQQVAWIIEILEAMKVPVFSKTGHEADDMIATIARHIGGKEDVELRIVSSDKDLHQLLTDRVKLWDPLKERLIDAKVLEKDMGYTAAEALEIQTLTGDSTDNVPGIPGVGPKKALALIKKYGTAEAAIAHADEQTPKLRENLLAGKDTLEITRRLVTLNRNVDFPFRLESCKVGPLPEERVRPIFERLGFRRLMDNLEKAARSDASMARTELEPSAATQPARGEYHLVDTKEKFRDFLSRLRGRERFAIDTETTGLHPIDSDLVGLSFAWKAGEAWYLPLRSNRGATLEIEPTLNDLRPILEDQSVEKCGQNIKFDICILRNAGITLGGVAFDSMVASYLVRPERRNHSMDTLARDLLSHETIPISDIIGKGRQQITMLDADPERLAVYAAEDADITWRLCEKLAAQIEYSRAKKLFEEVEMPLVSVLADMEYQGVTVDCERLKSISQTLEMRISELKREIHEAAGREFTIHSPKQLAEVLFDEQGLRVVKKTKTSRSTDASVLQTLAVETAHPLPRLVLEFRELSKLRSTYVEPLPELISGRSGRIHASFHQTVAATGRLSSSNPNLQNIPVRTEQGREIRKAFVPRSADHVLITADYSQIELRILAHLSKDPALVEAFRTDQDIHRFVASQVYGVPLEAVTGEQRTRAKAVNFGIIYGQGPFGLARTLGIPRGEASEFIRQYKERYSGIVDFMEKCVETARREGSVSTMLERSRPIQEIHSRNGAVRAQGERLAINTVVQGSAADMIKVAMVNIHRRIEKEGLDLRLLVQVHDELVFEAPRENAPHHAEMVRQEMTEALPLDVPLRVDVSWGDNWLEGKG